MGTVKAVTSGRKQYMRNLTRSGPMCLLQDIKPFSRPFVVVADVPALRFGRAVDSPDAWMGKGLGRGSGVNLPPLPGLVCPDNGRHFKPLQR